MFKIDSHTDFEDDDDDDEEFSTSLSVGDGHYLVDLGRYADLTTNISSFSSPIIFPSFTYTCYMILSTEHVEIRARRVIHACIVTPSSSEFIVDEECILQLFKSCRECNRQCAVRKHVKGLKLVVYQTCCFCQSHCKWTNLPDDDEDFLINGTDAAHGQTNSTISSSNTS